MKRNIFLDMADWYGYLTYVFVMGGGFPYWPALFIRWPEIDREPQPAEEDAGTPPKPWKPFISVVPGEVTQQQREEVAA